MSDTTPEIEDAQATIQMFSQSTSAARGELAKMKAQLVAEGKRTRRVSDHAVVRYLERVQGIDIDGVRDAIRAVADQAVPFKKCDGAWHEATKTVLILSADGGVITVLSEDQAEKYVGRRLVDGAKAEVKTE